MLKKLALLAHGCNIDCEVSSHQLFVDIQEQTSGEQHETALLRETRTAQPLPFKKSSRNTSKAIHRQQSGIRKAEVKQGEFASDEKYNIQGLHGRINLERTHGSNDDSPSLKQWKRKMGIMEEEENLSVPDPMKVPRKTAEVSYASRPAAMYSHNESTERNRNQEMPAKESSSFDINQLLGDVIQSNSRSKAFISNAAKDFNN